METVLVCHITSMHLSHYISAFFDRQKASLHMYNAKKGCHECIIGCTLHAHIYLHYNNYMYDKIMYMYTHTHARTHTHTHTHTHTRAHTCTHTHAHAHTQTYSHTYTVRTTYSWTSSNFSSRQPLQNLSPHSPCIGSHRMWSHSGQV